MAVPKPQFVVFHNRKPVFTGTHRRCMNLARKLANGQSICFGRGWLDRPTDSGTVIVGEVL